LSDGSVEHRAAADSSGSIGDVDVKLIEFNPWQFGGGMN